ncbi:MAG: DUF1588 domain-containing protein [Archangiaceae bacterium]|nr:DUF1588 domain-containing protein [Archangiaceae bacterium]
MRLLLFAPVLLLVPGCTGEIVSGAGPVRTAEAPSPGDPVLPGPSGLAPPRYTCAPATLALEDPPLKRLTRRQWEATVRAAVASLAGSDAPQVLAAISPDLAAFPQDRFVAASTRGHDGFQRADQVLTQQHADAQYALAEHLGRELTSTPARLGRAFGTCLTDSSTGNDAACLDTFLKTRGARLLRRPFDDADVAFYRRALRGGAVDAPALADVLALLFASPELVLQVEQGEAEPALARLEPHQLATRLSFAAWDEPADDVLWALADSGELFDDATFRAQVARLLADARARQTLHTFFEGWFALNRVADPRAGLDRPDYRALVGPQALPASAAGLIEDVYGAVDATLAKEQPIAALLADTAVYTRDAATAALYGAPPWDGASAPLPGPSGRGGLLTRLAFLVTGNATTHPILRGVRIRTGLLCDPLGEAPPDAAAIAAATPLTGTESERQRTSATTEHGGCAACHATAINPLGYALERFDALGRERALEQVRSPSDGALLAEHPVDTRSAPRVVAADLRPTDGAIDLTARIIESKKVESCLATQLVRFTWGKAQVQTGDACLLADLEQLARSGASVTTLVAALFQSESFRRRVIEP